MKYRRLFIGVQVLFFLACTVAVFGLFADAWFEVSSGYMSSDTLIFQTVGRGIINGFKPWSDLFETKPPGVFLLSAISLKLFGSQFLVKFMQAMVLLVIPFTVVIPAVCMAEGAPASVRKIVTLCSVLFGAVLALYAGNQAGYGLAESYGAAFAMAYVAALSGERVTVSVKRMILLGLLLLGATGFKEPFVLSILAGVVLLAPVGLFPVLRFSILHWFLPSCIAAFLGLFALYSLGWWEPFFGTYLPHMLGFHILQYDVPLPLRALEIWRVFLNLGVVSWFAALGITLLWLSVPVTAFMRNNARGDSVAFLIQWLFASYIAMLSVAAGGDFYGHHFVFALPFYLALFLKFEHMLLQSCALRFSRVAAALIAVCFMGSAFIDTNLSYGDLARRWKKEETFMISVAHMVDVVMERCGYERYLQGVARGGGPYSYTKASPYGPIFIHFSRFIGASKVYQDAYLSALQETPFILMSETEDSDLSEYALQYISERFTKNPPVCAGQDFVQPKPFVLLFANTFKH